jgi:hypothetical protein
MKNTYISEIINSYLVKDRLYFIRKKHDNIGRICYIENIKDDFTIDIKIIKNLDTTFNKQSDYIDCIENARYFVAFSNFNLCNKQEQEEIIKYCVPSSYEFKMTQSKTKDNYIYEYETFNYYFTKKKDKTLKIILKTLDRRYRLIPLFNSLKTEIDKYDNCYND